MAFVRPLYLPPIFQDSAESGRVILRDGTTASIRPSRSNDHNAMQIFFAELSPDSQRQRFFCAGVPSDKLIEQFCDSSNPDVQLTLVITRGSSTSPHFIGVGSYMGREGEKAEVAIAVADAFQGKGVGTLLLERLAFLAVRHRIVRFWAVTSVDNARMTEVFRSSGFAIHQETKEGVIEVDLSAAPTKESMAQNELRDRLATAASLRPFFNPASVAVIGASRDPSNIGHRIVELLIGNSFQGAIYPVNPHATKIAELPAYGSVLALPDGVDMAVVVVPHDCVMEVVDQCAQRGIKALVVISAGFAETGAAGRELQQQLVEKIRSYGMRMVGPNCLGLINTDPHVRLNASFSPVFPPTGAVTMSSQSGALGLATLAIAKQRGIGVSTFVSIGNKADVSSNDLLQFWENDERSRVILLYVESFGNPRRFARIARRVSRTKPIIALKAGRTQSGSRAAGSHTAALAESNVAVDTLFRQAGVIRAETLAEMFDLAAALEAQPPPRGNRVAIITNAGGPGILCADACEAGGLTIPQLSEATKSKLRGFLPPAASLNNPVDMIASASPEQFRQTLQTLLADDDIDGIIVIFIPIGIVRSQDILSAVAENAAQARAKPILACVMAEDGPQPICTDSGKIPVYEYPEAAGRALAKIAAYAEWRKSTPGLIPDFNDIASRRARDICLAALASRGPGWLTAEEIRAVLTAMRLPMPREAIAKTADEAVALARRLGFPVAVKLTSHSIVHKSDFGGVHLSLEDENSVRLAFEKIRSNLAAAGRLDEMDGVIVQPMIRSGLELMMGVTTDPLFGPLIAFGLGGIHVEIMKDICFRITPLSERDAAEMVQEIHGYRLLEGYRGHPAADIEAIEEMLLRLSRLVEEVPEIAELDLNPVFALPPGQGCVIADARIRVQK